MHGNPLGIPKQNNQLLDFGLNDKIVCVTYEDMNAKLID